MTVKKDRQKKEEEIIEPEEVIEINPDDQPEKSKSKSLTVLIILAILYIISPIDLIPESLFGPLGLIDDAAVLAYLIKSLYDRFRS